MKTNMGSVDKMIRALIAVVIGVLYYQTVIDGTVAVVLLVVAGAFVVTSFVGICPLYLPLGISTCKKKA